MENVYKNLPQFYCNKLYPTADGWNNSWYHLLHSKPKVSKHAIQRDTAYYIYLKVFQRGAIACSVPHLEIVTQSPIWACLSRERLFLQGSFSYTTGDRVQKATSRQLRELMNWKLWKAKNDSRPNIEKKKVKTEKTKSSKQIGCSFIPFSRLAVCRKIEPIS